jgi:hypothetical protein
MKTATTEMSAHIAQETTTLAGCLKITRKDGEVFAYTTHDQDLVISNGDSPETFTTYQANGSYVPSASQTDNQMGVPNEEITGAIMATDITYQELVAGKFNGATVQKFFVNWADLTQGKVILPGYKLGTVTPEDNHFRTELRGMIDTLRARTGEVAEPVCRVDLFSPECGLNADDFVQHGTVVSTDGRKTMVVSGITDSFFPLFTEDLLVPPAATPWEFTGGINSAFDFGNHSGTAPIAAGTPLTPGWKVGVYYQSGWVKISDSERPHVDANGQRDDISGDTMGSSGNYFPTHYAITGKSTLGKGGLIVAFTDGSGNVIEVHADGNSGFYTVPVGASKIQLGINDDSFLDNLGTGFNVQIQCDRGINTGVPDLSQYSQGGRITFTSGAGNGYTTEIKTGLSAGSPLVNSLQLYLNTPFTISPGDTFDIWPSCDKTPHTCLFKFKNIINFRGFKYLPGVDAARVTQLIQLP